MSDLAFEGRNGGGAIGSVKGFQGLHFLHVALNRSRCMTFHQIDGFGSVPGIFKGSPDRRSLGHAGGFHQPQMAVAGADAP